MSSCTQKSTTYLLLENVDTLLRNDCTDSASFLISSIDDENISEADMAYYNLLNIIIQYRNYEKIESDSSINSAIKVFQQHNDTEKLAMSYYYKSCILDDLGKRKEAIIAAKDAENVAEIANLPYLLTHIYRQLTILNSDAGQFQLALEYAKKGCENAKKLKVKKYLAYSYIYLTILYNDLGNIDSAKFYLDKCLLYTNEIELQDRGFVGNQLGEYLINIDTSAAKKMFNEAIKYNQIPEAYLHLSSIAKLEKDTALSKAYIDSALIYAWPEFKLSIFQALAEEELRNKNLQKYSQTMQQILLLKDSITQRDEKNNAIKFQKKYDFEKQSAKFREQKNKITSVSIIVFLIAIIIAYTMYLSNKSRVQSIENEKNKEKAEKAILAQQNAELAAAKAEAELYTEIMDKQNISLLKKNVDMTNIIASCKTRIEELEQEGRKNSEELDMLKTQMAVAQNIQKEIEKKGKDILG